MFRTGIRVIGLQAVLSKMKQMERDVNVVDGDKMRSAMRDSLTILEGASKGNLVGYESPSIGGVDTGRLRSSIRQEIKGSGRTMEGIVGSNVEYAPFVEKDTRPHFPPLEALSPWAERHGTTPYLVAIAIARRGTKGKRFMERAIEENKNKIIEKFRGVIKRIVIL